MDKFKTLLPLVVDAVDAFLAKTPIALPLPKAFAVSDLSLAVNNGYIELAAHVAPAAELPLFAAPAAIQCPTIPKAHPDSCI